MARIFCLLILENVAKYYAVGGFLLGLQRFVSQGVGNADAVAEEIVEDKLHRKEQPVEQENEMKKRLGLFIGSLLQIFAVMILIFAIATALIGKESEKFPNLFLLENEGIAVQTLFQLFAFSFLICALRFFFFTDVFLKKTGLVLRYVLFFVLTIAVFVIITLIFSWIPNKPLYWLLVLASYSVSTIISIFVTTLFARKEDEKLNDALAKMKNRQGE